MILLAGIAIFAISSISNQAAGFENYVNGVRARADSAHLVLESVGLRAVAARNLVIVSTPADMEAEKQLVSEAHAAVVSNLQQLKELAKQSSTPAEGRRMIENIDKIESQYAPVALGIVDLALQGKRDEAISKINKECRPLLMALVSATNAYGKSTALLSSQLIKEAEDNFFFGKKQAHSFQHRRHRLAHCRCNADFAPPAGSIGGGTISLV